MFRSSSPGKRTDKLPTHVYKDGAKWLMVPSKVFLVGVSVWPEPHSHTLLLKLVNLLYLATALFFLIGQILYVSDGNSDLGSRAYAISLIVLSIGTIVRRILCYRYKEHLTKILRRLYYEFWPSDIAGEGLHKELADESRYLFAYCAMYTVFAFVWGLQAIILPILYGKLPLSTRYPFGGWSPYCYGVLYVWQAFMSMELVFNICGLDLFFVSLLLNCVGQFKLLKGYIGQRFEEIRSGSSDATPMNVLISCIQRHSQLIETCKEIEGIFTYFILVQYMASIGAVCLSSFVATAVPGGLRTSLSYGMGHVCEIFIYCYMGENLIIESNKLSDAVYECGWHLLETQTGEFRKTLILIMVRSQRAVRMSAGGFGFLSLSSFMKLIQFSFSVYTLLHKMMKKQHLS